MIGLVYLLRQPPVEHLHLRGRIRIQQALKQSLKNENSEHTGSSDVLKGASRRHTTRNTRIRGNEWEWGEKMRGGRWSLRRKNAEKNHMSVYYIPARPSWELAANGGSWSYTPLLRLACSRIWGAAMAEN